MSPELISLAVQARNGDEARIQEDLKICVLYYIRQTIKRHSFTPLSTSWHFIGRTLSTERASLEPTTSLRSVLSSYSRNLFCLL